MGDAFETAPLTHPMAAEVCGLDVSADLAPEVFDAIEDAFSRHSVLVFRKHALEAAALVRFARRFGRIAPDTIAKYGHPQAPEISYLTNVEADGGIDEFGVRRALAWHYDGSFAATPPISAMLHALEVPATGGGTLFADIVGAAAAMPADLASRVAGLETVNHFGLGPEGRDYCNGLAPEAWAAYRPERKPLLMRHPATERELLEFCMIHTAGFTSLSHQEGAALLAELLAHATSEEHFYYHHWRPGDLVLWDEHAIMHRNAADFPPGERRVMLRAMVAPTT